MLAKLIGHVAFILGGLALVASISAWIAYYDSNERPIYAALALTLTVVGCWLLVFSLS